MKRWIIAFLFLPFVGLSQSHYEGFSPYVLGHQKDTANTILIENTLDGFSGYYIARLGDTVRFHLDTAGMLILHTDTSFRIEFDSLYLDSLVSRRAEWVLVWDDSLKQVTAVDTLAFADSLYFLFSDDHSPPGWYFTGDTVIIDTSGTGGGDSLYFLKTNVYFDNGWYFSGDSIFIDTTFVPPGSVDSTYFWWTDTSGISGWYGLGDTVKIDTTFVPTGSVDTTYFLKTDEYFLNGWYGLGDTIKIDTTFGSLKDSVFVWMGDSIYIWVLDSLTGLDSIYFQWTDTFSNDGWYGTGDTVLFDTTGSTNIYDTLVEGFGILPFRYTPSARDTVAADSAELDEWFTTDTVFNYTVDSIFTYVNDSLYSYLYDTLFISLSDTLFNYFYDSLYNELYDTLSIYLYDSLFVSLYDTLLISTIDSLTIYFNDSIYSWLYDSLYIQLSDTLYSYLYDTLYISLSDTLYQWFYDSLYVSLTDSLIIYINDTLVAGGSFVETDPEWILDSTDYLHRNDTTTSVASRWWVRQQGYITGNQTITLSGDVTGSGTTAITTTVGDNSHNHNSSTITTNIVSSVENVVNDGGNIDLVPAGILTITGSDVNNNITFNAVEVDGSTTNEIQALTYDTPNHELDLTGSTSAVIPLADDDGATEGLASFTANDFNADANGNISIDYVNGQKANGSQNGFLSSTDWTTFNNKVGSEVDGSVTNEGLLSVAAGGLNDSRIRSNTSGGTGVVINGGTNISVTEADSMITITAASTADNLGDHVADMDLKMATYDIENADSIYAQTLYVVASGNESAIEAIADGSRDAMQVTHKTIGTLSNVDYPASFWAYGTTGTASGAGVGYKFISKDAANQTTVLGMQHVIMTDNTNGSEDSKMVWQTITGGSAPTDEMTLTGDYLSIDGGLSVAGSTITLTALPRAAKHKMVMYDTATKQLSYYDTTGIYSGGGGSGDTKIYFYFTDENSPSGWFGDGDTAKIDATGSGGGTVTNIGAGNGMSFTDIETIGDVVMGTPSSVTGTSTNGFPTSTTHTHEVTIGTQITDGNTDLVDANLVYDFIDDQNFLTSEVDGLTTNEGSLTTDQSGFNATISSNTSGSTPVTLAAGDNITLTESGNTITIASTAEGGGGGTVTSITQGNGMSFSVTPITTSGTISLGTPSPVTGTSGDVVSPTTHSHSVTTGAVANGATNLVNANDVFDFVEGGYIGTGEEVDPKVGSLSTNYFPYWNGTTLANAGQTRSSSGAGYRFNIGDTTYMTKLEYKQTTQMLYYLPATGRITYYDAPTGSGGVGDMTKAVYDENDDGIVDEADKVTNALTNDTWITSLSYDGSAAAKVAVDTTKAASIWDLRNFITENQTITLSGDVTGSGKTAITTTIANDAVEYNMLNDNIISSQTALTSGLASDDEILISDAGVLKRMDVSVLSEVIAGGSDNQGLTYNYTAHRVEIDDGTPARIPYASTDSTGLLTTTDWDTFNNKASEITGNLTESIAGLQFSATQKVIGGAAALSLQSGYFIPLIADTSHWGNVASGMDATLNIYTANNGGDYPNSIYLYDGGGDGNGKVGLGINSSLSPQSDIYLGIVDIEDDVSDSLLVMGRNRQLKWTSRETILASFDESKWDKTGNYVKPKAATDTVIVGTTLTPEALFHVQGNAYISGQLESPTYPAKFIGVDISNNGNNKITYGADGDDETLQFYRENDNDVTMFLDDNGYIGVNNIEPRQELDVTGDVVISDTLFSTYLQTSNVSDFNYASNQSLYSVTTGSNVNASDQYNYYIVKPSADIDFNLVSDVSESGRVITIISDVSTTGAHDVTIKDSGGSTVIVIEGEYAGACCVYKSVTLVCTGSSWYIISGYLKQI